ncbi:hypothetical protein AMTR_s00094p00131330 [Amborella trichopoda]|uniref:Uncharacterized protein n=1 Tax=Amborella trichopoda TaxID=13333 RepID=W1NRW0_AMBTC|nr:hypothetical protein AMTR_s00094p00131330 [Amborella trichopoda]
MAKGSSFISSFMRSHALEGYGEPLLLLLKISMGQPLREWEVHGKRVVVLEIPSRGLSGSGR